MSAAAAPGGAAGAVRAPRRGLVLGAGGVLGAAWTVGALCAVEEVLEFDPRDAEIILGTSAGSVLAALLAAGVSAGSLREHQRGKPHLHAAAGDLDIDWDHDRSAGGALPPRPRPRLGSPELLRHAAIHPRRVRPLVTLTGLLPRGQGSHAPLAAAVASVIPDGPWPRAGLWLVALDYRTGERVVFGRDGAPAATVAQAVTASCSIPGWHAPVSIAGRDYIDGGAGSSTSTDLLAGLGLDEIVVLAPTASFVMDRPGSVAARLERRWRRYVTGLLVREARVVEDSGTSVTVLGPGPEDLDAIGANLMDPSRRLRVLETSLSTSPAALRHPSPDRLSAAL